MKELIIQALLAFWLLFISIYGCIKAVSTHSSEYIITDIELNSCKVKEIPYSFTGNIFWIPLEEDYQIGDTLKLK